MHATVIREATAADAGLLAALRYEFRREIGGTVEDRNAFIQRCSDWMASRIRGLEVLGRRPQ